MDGPDPLPPLSAAQLEIMNVVWGRGEATVAEVWRALSARRKVARNTVLTMLARLEEEGGRGALACVRLGPVVVVLAEGAGLTLAIVPRSLIGAAAVARTIDEPDGAVAEDAGGPWPARAPRDRGSAVVGAESPAQAAPPVAGVSRTHA